MTPPPARAPETLVRVLGPVGLAAAIVNITIGGGIFRLPANMAGALGAAAPLAYLVCAVAMALIVWCIADAGRRVTLTGGPYAYVGTALGPYAGFISGVMLWMLGTFAGAAVSTVFASSVGLLVPALASPIAQALVLVGAFLFWTVINLQGAGLATRLNTTATFAKLLPLLLVAVGGLFFIEPANLTWTTTPPAADIARTSLLLIFAFAGIEVALVPSGEVRDPERTVPRAIAIAMVAITTLYLLLQVVAQGVLGPGLATATAAPLADTARQAFGGWAGTVLLVGASVSMFGYLGGMTMSMPRMVYAFARDGYLPAGLGTVSPGSQAPAAAIVVQTLITLALALSGTFEQLALLANVSALALYLGCAIASARLRGGLPLPQAAATVVIVWLLTGLQAGEWVAFGVGVAAASVVYVIRRSSGGPAGTQSQSA